jgi:uncharacterized protein YwqG
MSDGHDRRSFLRELLRGAQRAAGELASFRDSVAEETERAWGPGLAGFPETTPRPVTAVPVWRTAAVEEVRELCRQIDRPVWADAATTLVRPSIRLTPDVDGRSWLGGSPRVPAYFEWPTWEGLELTLLGQLRLDDLPPTSLPDTGSLLFFFALDRMPRGLKEAEAGACRVVHVTEEPEEELLRGHALPEMAVAPSVELTLPDESELLELDGWAFDEWAGLRERLAAAQGVELEERATDYHALHRLLGYPDTYAGGMELDAQLVAHGIDLDDEPYTNPRTDELSPGAADWRLLLQLSADDELGVELDYLERLFVWIRDEDLRIGRFDRVRAFVR